MVKNKIDFKGAAIKAGGHAAGGAAYTQLNKLLVKQKFLQNADGTPKAGPLKGLVVASIGYLIGPLLASKMKMTGKGNKASLVEHAMEGIGMIGIMQAANAQFPPKTGTTGLFPTISGTADELETMGLITEEDQIVSGYEESPIRGYESANGNGIVR